MRKNEEAHSTSSEKKPSTQLEKRIRRLQEDILGNEALGNAYLEQTAADEMLSWSLSSVASIATETEGMNEDDAELSIADRLKALRKLMRHLGRLLGEGKDMNKDDQNWFWNSIQAQANALYGDGLEFPTLDEVMDKLEAGESPRQIIVGLRKLFETKKI